MILKARPPYCDQRGVAGDLKTGISRLVHRPKSGNARLENHDEHYSAEVLFSDEARVQFVEPDLDAIPRHGE